MKIKINEFIELLRDFDVKVDCEGHNCGECILGKIEFELDGREMYLCSFFTHFLAEKVRELDVTDKVEKLVEVFREFLPLINDDKLNDLEEKIINILRE